MKLNTKLFFYFLALTEVAITEGAGRRLLKGKRELNEWNNPPSLSLWDLNTIDPDDLVDAFLRPDSNLIISNVEYEGALHAAGKFTSSASIYGFDDGIALTTGSIYNIAGPNKAYNTTTNNALPGDYDLDYFFFENTRMGTHDATSLKFDFECDGYAELIFEYVFASEEYNEYVGSDYNDVFAFFLNGENIAVLPDGSNTAINSVHCGNDSPLDLSPPVPPSPNCNLFIDNEDGHVYSEFDGLTQVLTAQGDASGGVNTIKLAIADVSDGKFDSAVFLKSGSFRCIADTDSPSNPPTPEPTFEPTPNPTLPPVPPPTPPPINPPTAVYPKPQQWGSNGGSGAGTLAGIGGGGEAHGGGGGENAAGTSGRGQSVAKSSGEGSGAVHGMAGGEGFGAGTGSGIGYTGGFGGEGFGHGNTGGATYGDSGGGGGGMGNAYVGTFGRNSVGGAAGAGDGGAAGFGTAIIGSQGTGYGEGYGIGHMAGGWRRNRRRNLQFVPVVGGEGGGDAGAFQNSNAGGIGAAGGGGGATVYSAKRGHASASGGGSGTFGAWGTTAGGMFGDGMGFGAIDEDGNTYGHGESLGGTGGFADGEAAGGGMGTGWSNAKSSGQLAGAGAFGGGEGYGMGIGETIGGAFGNGFADGYAEMHFVETDAPVAAPVASP